MVTKNGELGPDGNNREKSSNEELKSMDFLKRWFETKKQTDIIEDKSKLADLKDDILESMWHPKWSDTSWKSSKESPKTSWKYASLASTEGDRIIGDETKGALEGMKQSFLVPFKIAGNFFIDTGKLALFPRKEIQNTLAYLEEVNPGIQNI